MMVVGKTHFKNTDFIYYPITDGMVDGTIDGTGGRDGGRDRGGDRDGDRTISANGTTYVRAHPPALGKMLTAGDVDIAPASSIIYAKNYRSFYILPDFSISGYGRTMSILLFSDRITDFEELEGKTIALPETSASSVALLDILLKMRGINARYIPNEKPDLNVMLKKADAALLIGDHALTANFNGAQVMCDLGEEWKKETGHKMVYALWIIGKRAAEVKRDEVLRFYRVLVRSREEAMRGIDTIACVMAEKIGVGKDFMKTHLRTLDYHLDAGGIRGLEEFFALAYKYGILKEAARLKFFDVGSGR